MELEITPEPTPAEREAITRALAAIALENGSPAANEWWLDGVREGVGSGHEAFTDVPGAPGLQGPDHWGRRDPARRGFVEPDRAS